MNFYHKGKPVSALHSPSYISWLNWLKILMHVLHVFNVIKATNTLSEKNLGCRFVEQVVTQKRAFFWRILFKALIHLEYDICLLLDAQSTSHSYSISHFTEIFGKLSQAIATEKWRIHLPRAGFINWGNCDVKRAQNTPWQLWKQY